MKKFDIFLAVVVAFAWGSSAVAVKLTILEIPSFLSLAIRFLVAALILLPFVPRPKIPFKDLYLVSVIFGVLYLGMLYYGLELGLDASLAIIVLQLNVPFSIIIARFFLNEPLTMKTIIGIALSFLGVLVVVNTPHLSGLHLAAAVILCGTFFYALFNIQNRRFKNVPALSLVCWTNLIAAPHLFLISYFTEGNPFKLFSHVTHVSLIALVYSVLVASFLSVALWVYLVQKYPINKVLPYNLLSPFFGVSLSMLFLGDKPSWHVYVGGAIILLGIAATQLKLPFLSNKRL